MNPVDFVDPDGKRWVNKYGKEVWNINGPTQYASQQEKILANTLTEHTTDEAVKLNVEKSTIDQKEYMPDIITEKLIDEFTIQKPLEKLTGIKPVSKTVK